MMSSAPPYYGIGNCLQNTLISFLTRGAEEGFEITSLIHEAILFICLSFMPRVVTAGVPRRTPDGLKGE